MLTVQNVFHDPLGGSCARSIVRIYEALRDQLERQTKHLPLQRGLLGFLFFNVYFSYLYLDIDALICITPPFDELMKLLSMQQAGTIDTGPPRMTCVSARVFCIDLLDLITLRETTT